MLKKFRLTLGIKSAIWKLRSKNVAMQLHINEVIRPVSRLLICLPKESTEAMEAYKSSSSFAEIMEAEDVVFVGFPEEASSPEEMVGKRKVILCDLDDLSWLFVPKRSVTERIQNLTPDVALDLNCEFFLPSAYLCAMSGAPLRIGLCKPDHELFYNLQYRVRDTTRPYAEIYKEFAETLGRIG